MNSNQPGVLRHWIIRAAVGAVVLAAPPAMAQPVGSAGASATGLNSLDRDRLYSELAGRGLDELLDRAFEQNNVPQEKRDAIRTISALRELSNPKSTLTQRQRRQLIQRITTGITAALPQMTDARTLSDQAAMLLQNAVPRDVNLLEFWGENPRTQGELYPIVHTILEMLTRVQELANKQAEQVAESIRSVDDGPSRQYMALEQLATMARYMSDMSQYYLIIATDAKAGQAQRKQAADEAIKDLAEFDNADSTVQPEVRIRIAKMQMAVKDYDDAKKSFDLVIKEEVSPKPTLGQQYEARYFSVVTDVEAGKTDEATKGLAELRQWQKASFADSGKSVLDGVEAAASMLEYRIANKIAQMDTDEAAKAKANQQAINVLLSLVKDRPELRTIIYDQLVARLPANADLSAQDPLLLQALVQKGDEERQKDDDESVDRPTLEKAIAAARELIGRKQSGLDGSELERTALLVPFFYEKLNQNIEAAGAFLDYIDQFTQNKQYASIALDNARLLIGELVRKQPADAQVQVLYERFLNRAVEKFHQNQFAYEYAQLLQRAGKYRDAIKYYQLVKADDPRQLQAQFFQMVSANQLLTESGVGANEQKQLLSQIQSLATTVNTDARKQMSLATTDAQRRQYQTILARSSLLAASLAAHQSNDPSRVLQLLEGFESYAKGLSSENDMLGEALFLRVQAYMAQGKNTQATDELVKLLNQREGGQGANIIFGLLQKLDADLDAASKRGDRNQMQSLASARATLSGYLVNWASNNSDPKIRQYTYRYRVFDADTKHLAARLEPNAAVRMQLLQQALEKYKALESPESVTAYRQTLAGTNVDANYPDPAVMLGEAKVYFDLGDYKKAQPLFAKLLSDKKLGTEMRIVDGQPQDNAPYWEATYKLFKCNVELAQTDKSLAGTLEQTKNGLKFLYIKLGDAVGGKSWHDQFEQLRKDIIPDFKVPDLS